MTICIILVGQIKKPKGLHMGPRTQFAYACFTRSYNQQNRGSVSSSVMTIDSVMQVRVKPAHRRRLQNQTKTRKLVTCLQILKEPRPVKNVQNLLCVIRGTRHETVVSANKPCAAAATAAAAPSLALYRQPNQRRCIFQNRTAGGGRSRSGQKNGACRNSIICYGADRE